MEVIETVGVNRDRILPITVRLDLVEALVMPAIVGVNRLSVAGTHIPQLNNVGVVKFLADLGVAAG